MALSGTMQNQLKRKPSAARLPPGGRTVKRRASKACHCCRARKVRCDVVESGLPCTNCRLDEVECVVSDGKRRRKSYADDEALHRCSRISSVREEKDDLPQSPMFDDIDGLNEFNPTMSGEFNQTHALEYGLSHHIPHMLYQTQGHRLTTEERSRRLSISGKGLATPRQLPPGMRDSLEQPTRPEVVLPHYIQPVSPSIVAEDLEYLYRKGAFTVPEAGFRNELLRCYVQYVHPYIPLINLGDFLATIKKDQPTDTISLLLFQAVMFAATAYVDMRYLTGEGYATRKEARKAFFQRVKLLYDFDYELDRVAVVQAVLLMTYWYENPDDPKDVWHWLGVAISVARTIGLNCDTSSAPLMSLQQRRLWKRIWWCLYMRDRLTAIGMRRPTRINNADFDVAMLELSDFEVDALPATLTRMLGGCPTVQDVSKRVTLAKMCIALAQLCVCISQVLAVQYSTLGHKIGATQETTMRLVPKRSAVDMRDILRCDQELDTWYEKLPRDLDFAPESRQRVTSNDGEVINMHRALLRGVYLTAVSALHRPQVLPSSPHVVIAPELRELSKRKVREAANDITDMYQDLFAQGSLRYLPNTGVTCLLPAIIIHLLDIKSANPTIRQASVRKFQFCMQALQRLRETYASADFAFSFLDAAVRKTNAQFVAGPLDATHSSSGEASSKGRMDASKGHGLDPLLLTPPPEAMHTASLLLSHSTLALEERNFFAAYTPPGSDVGPNSHTTTGAAASFRDVTEDHGQKQDRSEDMEEPKQNDFEALFDIGGGSDSLVADEDSVDLGMQWLNGFDFSDHAISQPESCGDRLRRAEEPMSGSGYAEQTVDITGDLDLDLEIRVES